MGLPAEERARIMGHEDSRTTDSIYVTVDIISVTNAVDKVEKAMDETGVGDDELATIMYDIMEYHPDVNDVAQMIQEQNVKRVALTHFAPSAPVQSMMNRFYVNPIKKVYDGELIAGGDGTIVTIPLD